MASRPVPTIPRASEKVAMPEGSSSAAPVVTPGPRADPEAPEQPGLCHYRHPCRWLSEVQKVYTSQSSGDGGRSGGTRFFTAGMARKKAITARRSSSSQLLAWSQIIPCQWSW